MAMIRLSTMNHLLYLGEMRQVHAAIEAANLDRASKLLEHWRPLRPGAVDLREWEWYYLKNLCGPQFTLWLPPAGVPATELAARLGHCRCLPSERPMPRGLRQWPALEARSNQNLGPDHRPGVAHADRASQQH